MSPPGASLETGTGADQNTLTTSLLEFFDTLIAILSGFMIVPAVYVFSGEEGLED